LRVAGFTIHVSWADDRWPIAPAAAASSFLVDPAPADVDITVHIGHCHRPVGAPMFDSGGPWRLYRTADGPRFIFVSPRAIEPYKIADFTGDFTTGRITLHEPFFAGLPAIDPLEYPLDELLVISLLAREQGVELHGCGILDGEDGYLFVGQSGAGKSTIARLWLDEDRAVVLSDDRIVVRAGADGPWIYGTPWHGEAPLASPRRALLKQVFLLRQLDRHVLSPVSRPDAVARMFAASFPAFHDAAAVDFTLGFLDRLAAAVPVGELGFAPTRSLVDFVRSA
jgi:hypothetical protein